MTMADKIISARLKHQRHTNSWWETNNPVLYDGEVGYVSDKNDIYKVGDGTSDWKTLKFAVMTGATSTVAGTPGFVPEAPTSGYNGKYLRADGTWQYPSNTTAQSYCSTAAATAAKTASCSGYVLTANRHLLVTVVNANTAASAITLNVNGKGAKPIYINGSASSASNYTLPAGTYMVLYDGTAYQFRTDGKIPGNISGNAATASSVDWANVKNKPTDYILAGSQTTTSSADGGSNVFTFTKADGTSAEFTVKNGTKGSTGAAAGFGTPTATVDANIGTPSVEITSSGTNTAKVFNFAFKNLKGAKGDAGTSAGFGTPTASVGTGTGDIPSVKITASGTDTAKVFDFAFDNLKGVKGDTGAAAGFGTPTATVGTGTGTPSVKITSSGENTSKIFNFAFDNLKGTPGAAAGFGTPTATVDANIGTPSVKITASGSDTAKVFNFAFSNLKGEKGDPGTSGITMKLKDLAGTTSNLETISDHVLLTEYTPGDPATIS